MGAHVRALLIFQQKFRLTVFPCMPKPKHKNRRALNFVTYFIGPHKNPANFARLELVELFSNSRMFQKTSG